MSRLERKLERKANPKQSRKGQKNWRIVSSKIERVGNRFYETYLHATKGYRKVFVGFVAERKVEDVRDIQGQETSQQIA